MFSYPDLGDSIPWLNLFPVVFVEDVILDTGNLWFQFWDGRE